MASFAVIFDMDGVLLDTENIAKQCWKKAAEEAAEDSEDALTKITELMTTMGLLAEFTAKFTAKALQGYGEMIANYPKILKILRERNPDAQIVLQEIPDPMHALSLTNNGLISIGQIMDMLVAPANAVIDASALQYQCETVDTIETEIGEDLHPTYEGYKKIAEDTYAKLRAVPGREEQAYTDVPDGKWYTEAVYYVREKGWMTGTTATTFSPDTAVTRTQIAQILYAKEGKPITFGKAEFSDVAADKWYVDAVTWAASKNIVAGYPDGTFRPDKAVTREELATMLYKYHGRKTDEIAIDMNALSQFSDASKVSKYAVTAMEWAVTNKLIGGTGKGLAPQGTATRAQVAVILMAYDKNLAV